MVRGLSLFISKPSPTAPGSGPTNSYSLTVRLVEETDKVHLALGVSGPIRTKRANAAGGKRYAEVFILFNVPVAVGNRKAQ